MTASIGYAAATAGAPLAPFRFERRPPGPHDLVVEALYCGVCHSDLHQVRNDWGRARFPLVPGHEIVGRVRSAGAAVTRHRVGDLVGIGCLIDSCRECESCRADDEPFCESGATPTYNGYERGTRLPTYGGFSSDYVVTEDFALRMPAALDPAAAAPLLCAGITTYAPLVRAGVGPGRRVGIVGLGGLGHMGIKIARALGATVVALSGSERKREDALRLGAHEVVLHTDAAQMQAQAGRLDFILDTVSAPHDLDALLRLLRRDSTMCLVGLPDRPTALAPRSLVHGRRSLTGSLIGGIRETQDMLDFCGRHGIVADIELLSADRINEAFERLDRGDVRYRFVIDLQTLPRT